MTLTVLGSRDVIESDVIGFVTIRNAVGGFL